MSPAEFNNAFLDVYDRLVAFLAKRTRYPVDLAHEAYERGYRYRHTFSPGEGSFLTWIHQVAINRWRDGHDPRAVSMKDFMTPSSRQVHDWGEAEAAWRKVDRLERHYREPWILRTQYEMSYEEIAELTGVKKGTVKSRINRARKILCGKSVYH
jgi:RNA polymerase sigma-70 factor, ECF subfamily